MQESALRTAQQLAALVQQAGGTVFYVGGCVRDRLLGLPSKDIDVEVHGISPARLEELLRTLGEPRLVGASFGIFGLSHCDLDIAMPRSEAALGRGHRAFAVSVDPFLGEEKAARRRDFTVNALMENVLTGEVLDFFGGRADLAAGVLRHVQADTFVEDPLRVLRAAQQAARFGFTVAEETIALCRTMELAALSRERVMGELEKALLKAEQPSRFFTVLRQMGQLSPWFPELEALISVPQPPRHHPEGDVWTHTLQVLDEAALLRDRAEHPLWLMLAALCHDFGKAAATAVEKDGQLHAYGHERAGLPLTEQFLRRLTGEVKLRQYVKNMVELHMQPNAKAAQGAKRKSFMKLLDAALCPGDLLLLARADHLGRLAAGGERESLAAEYAPIEQHLTEMLADYYTLMEQPQVTGQDLIAAGFRPGTAFAEALAYAHKLHLAGLPKEEALNSTLALLRKAERRQNFS